MDEREKYLQMIREKNDIKDLEKYYDNVDVTKLTLSELKEYLIHVIGHC